MEKHQLQMQNKLQFGYDNAAILLNDGKVISWGNGGSGSQGNHTSSDASVPVYILDAEGKELDGIIKISKGNDFTIALREDGTVWAWGYNAYGQLGNGGTGNRNYAAEVLDETGSTHLKDIIDINTSMYTSFALTKYGELVTWGYNAYGELANGGTGNSSLPIYPESIDNVVKIVSASHNAMALKSDGTVWAWGWNGYGQLSNGVATTNPNYKVPAQMKLNSEKAMTNVVEIGSSGGAFSAITKDGKVYASGANYNGDLGDGTTVSNRTYFTEVKAMYGKELPKGIVRLSKSVARTDSSTDLSVQYYIREDGSVLGSGKNTSYQLFGEMTTKLYSAKEMNATYLEIDRSSYIKVGETKSFTAKAVENFNLYSKVPTDFEITWTSSNEDVATIDENGVVTALSEGHTTIRGYDSIHGYITSGIVYVTRNSDTAITEPQVVTGGATDYNTTTKGSFTTVLKANGTVWASGSNDVGQLGNGTVQSIEGNLRQVVKEDGSALTNIVKIAAGAGHTLALAKDGKVYAWGWNNYGQLGTGDKTNYEYAVPVLDEFGVNQLSNIVDISAGYYHSSFVTKSGYVYQVGLNNYGQLGDNTNTNYTLPIKTLEMQNIVTVSSAMYYTAALRGDGTVWSVRI